jgi:hypothetical protein
LSLKASFICGWDAITEDVSTSRTPIELNKEIQMKKLMTVLLGLSLVIGTATVTFAQDTKTDKKTEKKAKKGKSKKTEEKK